MKIFTSEFLWSLYENDDRRQNIVWLFPLYWYKRRDAASRLEKGGPPFCSIFIRLWRFLYDRGKFFHHYTPSQESCLTLKKFIDALEYWRATISSHLSRIYGTRASSPFYFQRRGVLYHQQFFCCRGREVTHHQWWLIRLFIPLSSMVKYQQHGLPYSLL